MQLYKFLVSKCVCFSFANQKISCGHFVEAYKILKSWMAYVLYAKDINKSAC